MRVETVADSLTTGSRCCERLNLLPSTAGCSLSCKGLNLAEAGAYASLHDAEG